MYSIDVFKVGPLGYAADVQEIAPDGSAGPIVFSTRIYADASAVYQLAKLWIADNQFPATV